MDDIFGGIVLVVVLVLSILGVGFLISDVRNFEGSDVRNFEEVVNQCKEQGYIQDKRTRILCSVEQPN